MEKMESNNDFLSSRDYWQFLLAFLLNGLIMKRVLLRRSHHFLLFDLLTVNFKKFKN